MRMKPHVYAVNVKTMVTLGQETHDFLLLELGQTDGAFRQRQLRLGQVKKHGEGIEDS
jgi:hypothetical protein